MSDKDELIASLLHELAQMRQELAEMKADLDYTYEVARKFLGRAKKAEAERDQLAEVATRPLAADHPAIVDAEKRGHERGWDSAMAEVKAKHNRLREGIDTLVDAYDGRPHQTAQDVVNSLRALLTDHTNEGNES